MTRPGRTCVTTWSGPGASPRLRLLLRSPGSVRSFAHIVRTALPPLVPARPAVDSASWQELAGGEKYSPTWRLTVPEQLRTPEASAALQEVSRSRFLLPADPAGARQVLDEARVGKSLVQRIVVLARRARIADKAGDTALAGQLTDEARRLDAVVTGGS